MTDSSQPSDLVPTPARRPKLSAIWTPIRGTVWFIRTRPWLSGSAVVCSLLLGLVVFLQPGRANLAGFSTDDGDFVLLDDMDVFDRQHSDGKLHVTTEPDLLSPTEGRFASGGSGDIIQTGYIDEFGSTGQISVIRPDDDRPSLKTDGQAAWLTGTIEEPAQTHRYTTITPRRASR
jgi:hypothetical protein